MMIGRRQASKSSSLDGGVRAPCIQNSKGFVRILTPLKGSNEAYALYRGLTPIEHMDHKPFLRSGTPGLAPKV